MAVPEVTLKSGKLRGTTFKTRTGFSYNAFSGIRYAQLPSGNLRFKDPQPLSNCSQEDATIEGNMCPQYNDFFKRMFLGEEDCLFLNVYAPEDTADTSELPVMLWIHGGAFYAGSGTKAIYGPDYLVDKNVILVTINYRLGPLGFLCLNTPEVPGNDGLKDQVMALKWVNENIKQFGGDSNNITIFGESAGAASVHYLLLSPLAKGLFSYQSDPVGTAFKLGELLQLKTDNKD